MFCFGFDFVYGWGSFSFVKGLWFLFWEMFRKRYVKFRSFLWVFVFGVVVVMVVFRISFTFLLSVVCLVVWIL